MKTKSDSVPENICNTAEPTTFQIAQLAVMIQGQLDPTVSLNWSSGDCDRGKVFRDATQLAMLLWESASVARERHQSALEKIKELIDGVFTLSPQDWRARIQELLGDQQLLKKALSAKRISKEILTKQLFPDKNTNRQTKANFLANLPTFAKNHDLAPIRSRSEWNWVDLDGINAVFHGMLEARIAKEIAHTRDDGTFSVATARWLWEIRRVQIACNRRHGKP